MSEKNPDHVLALIERAINEAHEKRQRVSQRTYLPCSDIGNDCHRDLWMTLRWASPVKNSTGQKQRIFKRGDREECRIIDDLRAAGLHVSDRDEGTGRQYEYLLARGHAMARIDGAVTDPRGLLMSSSEWAMLEVKSHNKENFAALVKHGVRKAFPKHWAQCQISMKLSGLEKTIYAARNKNDESDRIIEITLDKQAADALVKKAEYIVDANDAPTRISIDPHWYRCRMCSHNAVCHGSALPLRNCRTCAFSAPEDGGVWACKKEGIERTLDRAAQLAGCSSHRWIPSLVGGTAELRDKNLEWVQYKMKDGRLVTDNGVGP